MESAWHQDAAACPLDTDALLTLWVALEDLSPGQGTLQFASRSHRKRQGRPGAAARPGSRGVALAERVQSVRYLRDADLAAHYNISAPALMPAGAVSAHLGWTFHRANANDDDGGAGGGGASGSRRALSISYFPDGATVHRDLLSDSPTAKGVPLTADDGSVTVVQVLPDDAHTWVPWILSRKVSPFAPMRAEELTPLLHSAAGGSGSSGSAGSTADGDGGAGGGANATKKNTKKSKKKPRKKKPAEEL